MSGERKGRKAERKVLFRWIYDEHGSRVLDAVEAALEAAGVAFSTVYDSEEDEDHATIYANDTAPQPKVLAEGEFASAEEMSAAFARAIRLVEKAGGGAFTVRVEVEPTSDVDADRAAQRGAGR